MSYVVPRRPGILAVIPALFLLGLSSSCNNSGGAAAPRFSTIPTQGSAGGSAFTLDLSTYTTAADPVTYTVVDGGGSFTGSVYTRTFPTLGTYTVSFKATDFRGEKRTGSFQVKVTSSEIAPVMIGTGMSTYDLKTAVTTSVFQDDGTTKTYKAALTNGSLIFEVTQSGQADLWLYNPNTPGTTVFAGTSKSEVYVGKTSKQKIVYMKGASGSRSIHLYDPTTDFTADIGAPTGSGSDTKDERNAILTSTDDLVFFESGLNGGQADIWYWDLSESKATLVSNDSKSETLQSLVANDAVVFSRPGTGGETDLFYFKKGVGTVEIGADLDGTSPFTESKTYKGFTTSGKVLFETTNGSDVDLYVWNSSNGQTTAIASSSNNETYKGVLSNGDVVYAIDTGSNGVDLYLYDDSANSSTAFTGATGTSTDYVFAKVLSNDDVVYTIGTALKFYDASATSFGNDVTGATSGTETFAGETSGGDFVMMVNDGSQTDLFLWDSSATTTVTISTTAGNDTYQAASSGGKIFFTRVASGNTTTEVFLWDPATTSATAITSNSSNESVPAVVSATVSLLD